MPDGQSDAMPDAVPVEAGRPPVNLGAAYLCGSATQASGPSARTEEGLECRPKES